MTKSELIEQVHKAAGGDLTKKQVAAIVDSVFKTLADYFVKNRRKSGVKFTYPGFGTFTRKKRKARKGRNPRTGEPMKIPASVSVSFTPGSELKKRLNK